MKEWQTLDVRVRFYIEHTPGTKEHLKQIVASYLKGKGVVTMQEYDGDRPQHPLVFELSRADDY
jgi:hypothetical protein